MSYLFDLLFRSLDNSVGNTLFSGWARIVRPVLLLVAVIILVEYPEMDYNLWFKILAWTLLAMIIFDFALTWYSVVRMSRDQDIENRWALWYVTCLIDLRSLSEMVLQVASIEKKMTRLSQHSRMTESTEQLAGASATLAVVKDLRALKDQMVAEGLFPLLPEDLQKELTRENMGPRILQHDTTYLRDLLCRAREAAEITRQQKEEQDG